MGIYIPNMQMPVGNEVVYIFSDGTVEKHILALREVLENGKAIPVPPHGDLIDRSALPWEKQSLMEADEGWALPCVLIEDAPIIIPSEK